MTQLINLFDSTLSQLPNPTTSIFVCALYVIVCEYSTCMWFMHVCVFANVCLKPEEGMVLYCITVHFILVETVSLIESRGRLETNKPRSLVSVSHSTGLQVSMTMPISWDWDLNLAP